MVVTLSGITMLCKAEHSRKADPSMVSRLCGNRMSVKAKQFSKTFAPMESRPSFNVTVVRREQL